MFLLSPARSAGRRADLLFNPAARFLLAQRLHRGEVVPISEIFTFLSGLYFRGKLAYARAFAQPPRGSSGIFVITTNRGLVHSETPLTLEALRAFSSVDIDHSDARYRLPLERDARKLAASLGRTEDVILPGALGQKKICRSAFGGAGRTIEIPPGFRRTWRHEPRRTAPASSRDGLELEYAFLHRPWHSPGKNTTTRQHPYPTFLGYSPTSRFRTS